MLQHEDWLGINEDDHKAVRKVVQKQLAPAKIVGLTEEEANDHEGDPILRIEVVFDAPGDLLDPNKVLGLGRHLRKRLHELGTDRFPIVSYMTPDEVSDAAA